MIVLEKLMATSANPRGNFRPKVHRLTGKELRSGGEGKGSQRTDEWRLIVNSIPPLSCPAQPMEIKGSEYFRGIIEFSGLCRWINAAHA